jgi:K+-transporting ATPase ATPase C chain
MNSVNSLLRQAWAGTKILIVLTILTGVLYPASVWAVSRIPGLEHRAEGSPMTYHGTVVGSSLIGTNPIDPHADPSKPNQASYLAVGGVRVADDRYFHTRPSEQATDFSVSDRAQLGLGEIDPSSSGASNLSQDSGVLLAQIAARKALIARWNGVDQDHVPADAVTASGSGLDPQISVAYADLQATRVAAVTGLPVATVRTLIAANTVGRSLGVLGEPGVNVPALNLAVAKAGQAARG